ncbi:hypothetical protein Bpfe_011240 [Biomphalaria pfeifferi]|uniref:Uncharacterized protein n=1 Tax=Biomphalaria pfeifferi TaxID=112525 RepID=A0AAD8BRI6_BIOPF|nr:hypothetical protein Bpfe_011240 [Biomphalaria pfeifferi]
MSAVLKEVNEQICTMIKQIGTITSLNKTDESFDPVMNKTDEQIATMSTCINNPLLNDDAVDGSVVHDCNSEPCKLGSYDKNPDICCDSAEHRSDHVIVIPACTQTFNKNCADGAASREEYDHWKTCQQRIDQTDFGPDTNSSKRSADGGAADGLVLQGRCPRAPQTCLPDTLEDYAVFDNLASWGPTVHRGSVLDQRGRPMVLMTTAMTSTASLPAMKLPSVLTERKARQRKRRPHNQRQINWRRRKPHLLRAVWMALLGARSIQSVTPTDRPPPALTNCERVSARLSQAFIR